MVGLLVTSLVIMGMLPQNFFPSLDKPYFRADVFYPEGYSIHQVERDMKQVEKHLMPSHKLKHVSAPMGSTPIRYYLAPPSAGTKPNFATALVELQDSKYTNDYEKAFDKYMTDNYPDAIARTMLFQLSPAVDAAIGIGFIGSNEDTLAALTGRAMAIMHRHPELRNIRNSWGNKIPVWTPEFSQQKAQPLGVSRQSMAQSIQIATNGMGIGTYREGDLNIPVLLRGEKTGSFNLNNLRTIPVFGNSYVVAPLEQIVSDFSFSYKYSTVKDYNREKVMMAQADPVRGQNTIAAFNSVYSEILDEVKVPEGYSLKIFGEKESQDESNSALAKNMPLTFFLMFVTLLLLFKKYRKPVVILLMLPLIFIGVVIGLIVFGKSMDFFAMLGLLGLIGMNIKNAIVLVDQIGIEIDGGLKPFDAVVTATKSRIVPVSMASGTTILGMLPLLFDSMFGGMAATIMGGLLAASLLTLVVLPVAYCAVHKIY